MEEQIWATEQLLLLGYGIACTRDGKVIITSDNEAHVIPNGGLYAFAIKAMGKTKFDNTLEKYGDLVVGDTITIHNAKLSEYGDVVWCNAGNKLTSKITRIVTQEYAPLLCGGIWLDIPGTRGAFIKRVEKLEGYSISSIYVASL